jgi:hypothetical protein
MLGLVGPTSVAADGLPEGVGPDEVRAWLSQFICARGLTTGFIFLPEYDYAELAIISPGLPYDDGRY